MNASISTAELRARLDSGTPPIVIDVRKPPAFLAASELIAGALRRDAAAVDQWARSLPPASTAVVYCVHDQEVTQDAAKALRDAGIPTQYLEGGIEAGWRANGGPLDAKPANASTRWVTRERPKIDRIACPWLISRFVDRDAEFLYVPTKQVQDVARERNAVAFDVSGVHFTHDGELCSFDAFIKHYRLNDPALLRLAQIVRAADTGKLDLAPQAPGLAAISLGLSRIFSDDHAMLKHGMVMYDAFYAWCKDGQEEVHTWNPEAYR